ncbi:acyltransferase family protein [Citrobacter koseri]|uniref:acyltransferase family protein n=1 Tax=Citrobacter koseri TaxID=545 RepID=UPI00106FA468|nr:acyltransferase [Citrobacter koseri]MBJ8873571.1 acyltransferase [Citrobacter koseri]VFS09800.1 O-acetyltransferase OatA [Citrobacter koseri]
MTQASSHALSAEDVITISTDKITSNKILSIQYLRGIAAMLVVLFHSTTLIGPEWKTFMVNGSVGVDVFFIMSGFIIYYITSNKSELAPKTFAIKRLLRIYPIFFIIWLLVSCIYYADAKFINVIKSLFLIHVDYNANAPAFKFNLIGPAWTLTYEIYFYVIFCFAGYVSFKYRGLLSSLILLLLPILLQLYFNGSFMFSSNAKAEFNADFLLAPVVKVMSTTMLWEFVGGIFLAFLFINYRENIVKINKIVRSCCCTILIVIFLYFTFYSGWMPQGMVGLFWPSMALVTAALMAEDMMPFEIKPLSFIGDISYSLYLVHWAIIKLTQTYFPQIWNNQYGVFSLFVFLSVSVLISFIMYKKIEKPSIKIARKLLN